MFGFILVDLLPLILLIVCLIGIKPVKPVSAFYTEEYLSLNTGKYYRGLLAIVIVLHHLTQYTDTGMAFRRFAHIGYLAVAFFFFLSGYGLLKSYMTKGKQYKRGFLLKRIPTVLIPYVIITAVYWLMDLVGGRFYSMKDILLAILHGDPIVSFSWYIIVILVFYVVFWLLMHICRKHYLLMVIGGIIWYVAGVAFCIRMGYEIYWYNTSLLLIVGMFWAVYEKKILEGIRKIYPVLFPVVWVACIFFYLMRKRIAEAAGISWLPLVLFLIPSILFVIGVLLFALKIQIGNKILYFLGTISLEIYISQGIFLRVLRNSFIYIGNELLWCMAVLAGTIVFAFVLHVVVQFILKRYRALLRRKGIT